MPEDGVEAVRPVDEFDEMLRGAWGVRRGSTEGGDEFLNTDGPEAGGNIVAFGDRFDGCRDARVECHREEIVACVDESGKYGLRENRKSELRRC